MKRETRSVDELAGICRLWIAAAEAKDARIEELERECEQLRMRVARLSRLVAPRSSRVARRAAISAPLRRTPTMA